jgi:hypothetical protein
MMMPVPATTFAGNFSTTRPRSDGWVTYRISPFEEVTVWVFFGSGGLGLLAALSGPFGRALAHLTLVGGVLRGSTRSLGGYILVRVRVLLQEVAQFDLIERVPAAQGFDDAVLVLVLRLQGRSSAISGIGSSPL